MENETSSNERNKTKRETSSEKAFHYCEMSNYYCSKNHEEGPKNTVVFKNY